MLNDLKVCTISKYPPYMSGHSFEAFYQGKALLEMTGEKHYEVTYDQTVYDPATNYNNSPELLFEAEQYLHVLSGSACLYCQPGQMVCTGGLRQEDHQRP